MYHDWAALCRDEKLLYDHIRGRLSNHQPKTYKFEEAEGTEAAVLVPLFFKNDQAHLLFTKRTDKVATHKGQISFPGGMRDEIDETSEDTALRETREEMGILEHDVTLFGRADNFLTNTHFLVTPWVGCFPYPYEYTLSADEIDRVIEVPLLHLLDEKNFEIKDWQRNGKTHKVHFYNYQQDVIWGVTGFLLSNFLHICFDLDRMIGTPA